MSPTKSTKKSAKNTAGKASKGFTAEETSTTAGCGQRITR
jgi:hypothetical protein